MNYDLEKEMTDLCSLVSFGGRGGGSCGGRSNTRNTGTGVCGSRGSIRQTGRGVSRRKRGQKSRSWGRAFKDCMRKDDTWQGSDTPATDTAIGCAAKATFERR